TGSMASGVPGALAAYDHAISKYGKLKLADILRPAAEIAEKGFSIDQNYARKLVAHASQLKAFPASSAVFLHPDGSVYKAGAKLQQPDLARTYRSIAEQGVGWFYRGPFAESTASWMKESGGLITAADFANYQIKLREPLRTTYRGYEVLGFPPPSSGGVHVAQLLNMLEERDLVAMGAKSADFVHVIAESMKLVFADRAYWLGDPDFAAVPRGLIDKGYARSLNKKVSLSTAGTVKSHGTPERAHDDIFGKHTTHISTADAEGNWVALTATINTGFGSKVVVPGTGVVLNNQMDDFSLQSGVANSFGLLGAEANAIAPGKRPLSSMSPTIVLKDGKPILSTGAAGGPTIISQTVLTLIYSLDFGMAPKQALAQPRIHHQWSPDTLKLEDKFGQEVRDTLRVRGHHLQLMNYFGACQAVAIDSKGRFQGAADPRVEGKSQVFSE
ncbi:MAG TPA: gamma-glutamyltransferase, partial [Roseimicrobium sp.]|nr:gamma-glutamyltransferase [Roseimicrobium sp.]